MIMRIDDECVEMAVDLYEPPPSALPLTLILALPRPKSLKKSIEAAASLGVKNIFIIESWRVEKSYWSSPVLAPEALRERMLLGLEQARDTVLPRIEIRRRFKPFVEDELPELAAESLRLVAHPRDAHPCPVNVQQPVVLMIGPEGGFIPYEIELLQNTGFTPVTIGERILRVETAIAAFIGRLS
jgi:RsmE family RNA methyltransferase